MQAHLLESIIAASLDAIVCADEEGRVILWNRAAEAMFGWSEGEALGQPLTMLLREEDRAAHLAGMKRFLKTGEPKLIGKVTESSGLRKDGSTFSKEMSLAAERVGGKWVFTAIMRDSSERKRLEASLRESESRYRSLVEHSFDSIIILQNGRVVFANQTAAAVWGGSVEEIIGRPFGDFVSADERGRLEQYYRERLAGGGPEGPYETRLIRKSGDTVPVEVIGRLFQHEGQPADLLSIRDLSARKIAEASFAAIIDASLGHVGEEFFSTLIASVCKWLHADVAIIGELESGEHIRALAMQMDGKPVTGYEYDLPGTPCNHVAAKGYCVYPEGVSRLFPEDRELVGMQAEGYVGTPLRDRKGHVVGILCAISRSPLELPPRAREVFDILAGRASVEILRQRAEKSLRQRMEEAEKSRKAMLYMLEDLNASATAVEIAKQEWEQTFDAVSDPIFLHDAEFRITRANRAYAEEAGLAVDKVIGRPYWEMFPRRDGPLPGCRRALEKAEEEEVGTGDGRVYLSRSYPVIDHDGVYRSSVHLMQDMTERKQAMEALRESEEKFRTVTASAQDSIIMMDDAGRIAYWNEAAERMFGHTRDEALGQPLHELIAPKKFHAAFEKGFARFRKSGKGEVIGKVLELPAIRKDGEEFIAEHSISAVKIRGRWHAIGLARDISERREAEGRLKASEARLQEIVNSNPDGILVVSDKGEALFLNAQAAKLFGRPAEGLLGLQVGLPVLAGEETTEIELWRPDGSMLTVEMRTVPMQWLGESAHVVALHDISERKRAEEEIASSHDRLKLSLVGTIAAVAKVVEVRDPYTAGHQRRVAELAVAMARELGWEEGRIEGLELGATIHDIGKVYIPAEILVKPSRLTEMEYSIIKEHPHIGHDILKDIEFPWPVAEIAWQHHERLDGSGYPQGLKGEDICEEARVVAVADVVEAMASHRPYRPGLGIERALEEIERGRGRLYDTRAADTCLKLFRVRGFQWKG